MTRTLLIFGLLLASSPLTAQQGVEYEISFPNLVHHEAEISVTFNDVTQKPLEVRMSRSSPGRYALHEFAKNVYAVTAVDGAGRPLAITRPNPHQWDVQGHDGTVTFRYTLFGDRADGTYTGIDNTHAHLNMPATFAWARGLEDQPISITFRRPRENWKIATQLVPTGHLERFTAPDLSYFLDSPTEISDFDLRSWEIVSNGQRQTIRLAVHHDESSDHVDRYAEMTRRVVDEQIAVFGEPPTFDHGTYTFIACYTPWVAGDGMEHRNSTILTSTRPLSTGALQNLGTVSHEFFHVWNVERLRPRSLEPFDFEEASMPPRSPGC
jgi:predicted metalloprotease with PDZ domain